MKKNPNDYAEMLIEQYGRCLNIGYTIQDKLAKKCAINDVNNTINAVFSELGLEFYEQVLTILKNKL